MISKQFLITAIVMACVAVLMSVLFRLQLAWPGEGFAITNFFLGDKWAPDGVLDSNMYLALVTIHGTIMVFFVLTGGLSGTFSNLLIPLTDRSAGYGFWLYQYALILVLLLEQCDHVGQPFRGRWTCIRWMDDLPAVECTATGDAGFWNRYDLVVGKYEHLHR